MFQLAKLRPRLGKTFIDRLTTETILKIGNNTYSRDDLVRECRCGNFAAARRLNKVLEDIGITEVADLAHLAPEDLARVKGVGETTVYVLLCLQDHAKVKLLEWGMTWNTYAKHAREKPKPEKKTRNKRASKRQPRSTLAAKTAAFNNASLPLA